MPVPYGVARFNRRVTDRFIRPTVRRNRRFATVHHAGRRTGTAYRTPVVVFDLDGDALVVLTYGTRADWFRNALTGPASLETDGCVRPIEAIERIDRDVARPALPWLVRFGLRPLTIRDVARLSLGEPRSPVS